jgi:hypothetical protein
MSSYDPDNRFMRCAMEHRQECGFTPPQLDMDNRFMRLVATERAVPLSSSASSASSATSSSASYRTWDNDTPNTPINPHRTWDDTPNDIRSRSNSMPHVTSSYSASQYTGRRESRESREYTNPVPEIQRIKWDRNNSNSRLRSNTIATSSLLKSNNNVNTQNKEEFPALVSKSAPTTPQIIQPKSISSDVPSLSSPIMTSLSLPSDQMDQSPMSSKSPSMTTVITFSKGKAIKHMFDATLPTSSQLESISTKNIKTIHTPKNSPYSNWADMFKDKPRVDSVAEEDETVEGLDRLDGYNLDKDWGDVC